MDRRTWGKENRWQTDIYTAGVLFVLLATARLCMKSALWVSWWWWWWWGGSAWHPDQGWRAAVIRLKQKRIDGPIWCHVQPGYVSMFMFSKIVHPLPRCEKHMFRTHEMTDAFMMTQTGLPHRRKNRNGAQYFHVQVWNYRVMLWNFHIKTLNFHVIS